MNESDPPAAAGRTEAADTSVTGTAPPDPAEQCSPWRTLSTREVYRNPWIRVEEDAVINPSGGRGIYGRVCFHNLAVGVIPVDADEHTWLVGQWRYPLSRYSWEIPMGGVPADEDEREGALRELREETGLVAGTLEELIRVDVSNCITDERGVVYVARDLTQREAAPEETEALAVRRVPLGEAIEMAASGRISDALSVVGLLALGQRWRA